MHDDADMQQLSLFAAIVDIGGRSSGTVSACKTMREMRSYHQPSIVQKTKLRLHMVISMIRLIQV